MTDIRFPPLVDARPDEILPDLVRVVVLEQHDPLPPGGRSVDLSSEPIDLHGREPHRTRLLGVEADETEPPQRRRAVRLADVPSEARSRRVALHVVVARRVVIATRDTVDTLDATIAPALVFSGNRSLLVARDRSGTLTLTSFDEDFRQADDRRILGDGVGAYAVASAPPGRNGAAVAFVEHNQELVLAIVGPTGEARNVPRVVEHGDAVIASVSLCPTDSGWAAAWATATGSVYVTWIDAFGVPMGLPRRVCDGTAPRIAWLPDAHAVALAANRANANTDPIELLLTLDGTNTSQHRWAEGLPPPVETPLGLAIVTLDAAGVVSLVHDLSEDAPPAVGREGTVTAIPTTIPASGTLIVGVGDSRGQRFAMACVSIATGVASSPLLSVRTGATTPSSMAVRSDGAMFVVAREPIAHGGAHLVAVQVTCTL